MLTLGALGSGTPSGALPLVLAGLGIVGVVVNSVRVGRVGLQIIGEFNRSLGDAALLHGYHATFASSDYFNAVRCFRDVLSQEAPSFVKIRAIFGLIAVLQKTREPECFGAALEVATDHLLSVMVPARLGSQSVQFACLETIKVVADRMRSTQFDTETNLQGEHPYFSPKNVRGLMTLYRLTSLVRPLASSVLKELPDDLLRRVGPFGIETRVALSELKGAVDSFFPPEPPESAKS